MIELQLKEGSDFLSPRPKNKDRVQHCCIGSLYSGFTHPCSIADYSSACGDDEECTGV